MTTETTQLQIGKRRLRTRIIGVVAGDKVSKTRKVVVE